MNELSKCWTKAAKETRVQKSMENNVDLLSIDCVVSSKLVFGSFAVESTAGVVVMVVDEDADGDDEPLR